MGWRRPGVVLAMGLGLLLAGCQFFQPKDRKLRQPAVEQYEVPPAEDRRFSDPPTYTEQKRPLAGPKSNPLQLPTTGPSMSGPGPGPASGSSGGSAGSFGGRPY